MLVDRRKLRGNGNGPRGFTLVELLVALCILVAVAGLMIPNGQQRVEDSATDVTRANLAAVAKTIASHYALDMSGTVLYDPANPTELDPPFPDGLPHPGMWAINLSLRPGYPQLAYLFVNPQTYEDGNASNDTAISYNPATRQGWKGPYLLYPSGSYILNGAANFTSIYGSNGDPAVLDGWGRPIVLQQAAVGNGEARLVSAGPNGILDTAPTISNSELNANTLLAGDDLYLMFPIR